MPSEHCFCCISQVSVLCFHFHSIQSIFQFPLWSQPLSHWAVLLLLWSMLLNIYMYMDFLDFFLLLISSFTPSGQKGHFVWFQSFFILSRFVMWLTHDLYWVVFNNNMKRMCFLLLLGSTYYINLLGQHCSSAVQVCIITDFFFLVLLTIIESRDTKFSNSYYRTVYFSL